MPPDGALAALHDVVVPVPVAYVPQTLGWLALLALVILALALLARRALLQRRANAYRSVALAELGLLAPALAARDPHAFGELSGLLKRVALRIRPREEVAALGGEAWLRFLDSTWEGQGFVGASRVLVEAPYWPPSKARGIATSEVERTLALVRRWVETHSA